MLQSIVIYGLIMFSMYILGKAACYEKQKALLYIWLSIAVFTFFSAVRYDVGVDYFSYLNEYERLLMGLNTTRDYESGFLWLANLLSYFHLSPIIYFGLWAFIQISVLYYVLKDYIEVTPYIGITLICFGTYFMWMNGIRQSIALMFFILSLIYTYKNDFFKFCLCIIIGFLFHKSIIILVPFYFFLKSRKDFFKSYKLQLILVVLCITIGSVGIMSLISPYINNFMLMIGYGDNLDYQEIINTQMESGRLGWGPRRILMLIINLTVIIYSEQTKKYYGNSVFILLYNIFFIGVLLESLFFESHAMMRLLYYFTGINFIMQAFTLNYLCKYKKIAASIYISLFFIVFIANCYSSYLSGETDHFSYKFYQIEMQR